MSSTNAQDVEEYVKHEQSTSITEIDVITPEDLKAEDGEPISIDEYMDQWGDSLRGVTNFDGGSPYKYPNLGLSYQESLVFREGLVPAAKALYAEPGMRDWKESWMLKIKRPEAPSDPDAIGAESEPTTEDKEHDGSSEE